jgi:hypothetical protein
LQHIRIPADVDQRKPPSPVWEQVHRVKTDIILLKSFMRLFPSFEEQ